MTTTTPVLSHQFNQEIENRQFEKALNITEGLRNQVIQETARYVLENIPFSNPIDDAQIVVSILTSPKNTLLSTDLRYEIARIGRLFAECCVFQAAAEGRFFPEESKKKLLDSLAKVLRLVNKEDIEKRGVAVVQEVENTIRVIKLFETDKPWFRNLFQKIFSIRLPTSAAQAVMAMTVAPVVAKLLLDLFLEAREEFKKETAKQIVLIDLSAQLVLAGSKDEFLPAFYEGIHNYRENPTIAFVALENIASFLKNSGYNLSFVQGPADDKPGLVQFAHLEGLNFWKVRYRAVEHLTAFHSIELPSFTHENQPLLALSQRLILEKNTKVLFLLVETHELLKDNPSWESLIVKQRPTIEKVKEHLEAKKQQLNCGLQADEELSEEEDLSEDEGPITTLERRIALLGQVL